MSKIQLIIVGAVLVGAVGAMTMIAAYPKLHSPYSFTVVIPALLIYDLNLPPFVMRVACVLPLVTLYLAWSFAFLKSRFKITLTQKVVSGLLVILSAVFNVNSFGYGLKYQGEFHTYIMYAYNISLVLGLSLILWANTKKPSFNSYISFSVVLFAWLGWVAFPWLGELI